VNKNNLSGRGWSLNPREEGRGAESANEKGLHPLPKVVWGLPPGKRLRYRGGKTKLLKGSGSRNDGKRIFSREKLERGVV